MLRRPTGIELSQLNRGSKASGKRVEREEGPAERHTSAAHRLASKNHFQAESRAVDVNKHMCVWHSYSGWNMSSLRCASEV